MGASNSMDEPLVTGKPSSLGERLAAVRGADFGKERGPTLGDLVEAKRTFDCIDRDDLVAELADAFDVMPAPR
ncbi:hypothetical protein RBS60_11105 [Sinomonas sp. ASV486]|uniref:Uncharacterized protein n=1 Tax=Sinomonas puerhi TaxID=3238584 RepID=A0AB39KY78_9MICC|nr:hypothetical protein [Sinomonas sp. ASV486]MDQ4490745.1 hypothetical protein [Sinomonas sp. ASV486]